jgi:hypothetical protein
MPSRSVRKDVRRDMTKLIVVFRNFAIAHKNCIPYILHITLTAVVALHICSHYEVCFTMTFGVLYQFRDWKQERKYMIYTLIQVSLLEATQNTQICNCLIKHNKWLYWRLINTL